MGIIDLGMSRATDAIRVPLPPAMITAFIRFTSIIQTAPPYRAGS